MWQKLKLYHGTDALSATSIRRDGIDLSRAGTFRKDFGPGFYLTTNESQAKIWASVVTKDTSRVPSVIEFILDRNDFHDLKILIFTLEKCDPGYWEFVKHCRFEKPVNHRCMNETFYDMVVGPVARMPRDSNPYTEPGFDQFCAHTVKAVDLLNKRILGEI
jgi:hypothetical protein